jgi:hypothetical protein
MLRSAHAGFVYSDTWAVAMRVRALPECRRALPALPAPLLVRSPRAQPFLANVQRPRLAAAAERAD